MKIALIIKKNSKRRILLSSLLEKIKQLDVFSKQTFYYTNYPGHAYDLAKNEALKRTSIVIGVGGDGTLNEIVNGLLHKGETETIFGYFPLGTANDFSKTAGKIESIDSFIESLKKPSIKEMDIGEVICESKKSKKRKFFINIADTGLGGFIAKKLNKDQKLFGGQFAYIKHTLLGFVQFKKKWARVQIGDFCYEGKLLSVVVCNGKVFGNGLIVSPMAEIYDGTLNVTLFGDVTIWDYIKNLPNLRKGLKIEHPNIFYLNCTTFSISTQNNDLKSEADGEYVGSGKTTYRLASCSLKLLQPPRPL